MTLSAVDQQHEEFTIKSSLWVSFRVLWPITRTLPWMLHMAQTSNFSKPHRDCVLNFLHSPSDVKQTSATPWACQWNVVTTTFVSDLAKSYLQQVSYKAWNAEPYGAHAVSDWAQTYHSCISPSELPVAMHIFWGWQSMVERGCDEG